jgi:hypothetical protein
MDIYFQELYNNNYNDEQEKIEKIEDIIYKSYEKYYFKLINFTQIEAGDMTEDKFTDELLNGLYSHLCPFSYILIYLKYRNDYRHNLEELYKEIYKPSRVLHNITLYGNDYYENIN